MSSTGGSCPLYFKTTLITKLDKILGAFIDGLQGNMEYPIPDA